mmetsp:Transcript_4735/g.7889  ORF Transcript_4735/g.7889 Transcript_4735/m.7889 type:complete len:482 (-) Transcript_4735:161-1606(-)|eukprot:CAMPEP_0196129948 /NCGR_PEP_ID=MMETSP0910-20130528/485_1 /TAXON_ID=49265 /ORGANISM="Thalassiosira rotula, Strain GSO102" /LENGTH=481 /DNA_ID=CAMNT_0041389151 /DNA_START=396 /DNA_END=1841 /DNA_ORIENTATION=-
MCQLSKIENMSAIKTKKISSSSTVSKTKRSGSGHKGKSRTSPAPAFQGAKFDKNGYCLQHSSIQLVNPTKDATGKLIYQELKATCPSCQSAKHKSKKNTSLGGGKVRAGHRLHGAPPSSSRSLSRSRSVSREQGNNGQPLERKSSRRSSRSKSRDGRAPRREYSTPFDSKGRCHYHKNVQLAAKKMTGGWKVLHSACPKCMEDEFDTTGGGGGDDRSVVSGSSRKSNRSGASGDGVRGDAHGQFDKNGCCVLHSHIQVAKKRVFGKGFKVVRVCPACDGGDVGEDDYSVRSGRSASSRKSSRSIKSSASRAKPGKASKSGRYGSLPFDGDGYCCRHPNVQLAKEKTLGGFKIIHDVCPECSREEDTGSIRSGRKKLSRRKSGTGRVFDDSGSETSSFKSGRSGRSGLTSGSSSSRKKKRIRVRNLKTEDEEGKLGRYSGYVNDDYLPHGNGVMKYTDGVVYDGVWSEGSKVHGKTKRRTEK